LNEPPLFFVRIPTGLSIEPHRPLCESTLTQRKTFVNGAEKDVAEGPILMYCDSYSALSGEEIVSA
jgi:hypothetical protein